MDTLARELPVEAPAGYFDELPGRVRARVRRPARVPRLAMWAAAAAAAVMVVVVTPLMLQRERAVVAPAAQAVPEAPAPAPAPATLAASIAPPAARRRFAERRCRPGAAHGPSRTAQNEARGRLSERATGRPPGGDEALSEAAGRRSRTRSAAATRRAAVPPAPPEAAAAAPDQDGGERRDPDRRLRRRAGRAGGGCEEGARAPGAAQRGGGCRGVLPSRRSRAQVDKRYEALLARRATSAAEARATRDAWELFARDAPADTRADEARVRAIEAGVMAWKLGHDPADLATATRARPRLPRDRERGPGGAAFAPRSTGCPRSFRRGQAAVAVAVQEVEERPRRPSRSRSGSRPRGAGPSSRTGRPPRPAAPPATRRARGTAAGGPDP